MKHLGLIKYPAIAWVKPGKCMAGRAYTEERCRPNHRERPSTDLHRTWVVELTDPTSTPSKGSIQLNHTTGRCRWRHPTAYIHLTSYLTIFAYLIARYDSRRKHYRLGNGLAAQKRPDLCTGVDRPATTQDFRSRRCCRDLRGLLVNSLRRHSLVRRSHLLLALTTRAEKSPACPPVRRSPNKKPAGPRSAREPAGSSQTLQAQLWK